MGLLSFIKGDEVGQDIETENKQMKKKVKNYKKAYDSMKDDRDLHKDKYIAILEEKGDSFNQYLYYQNKYNEVSNEIKDMKKSANVVQNDFKAFSAILKRFFTIAGKCVPTVSKCRSIDDLMVVLLMYYCTEKEVPKSILNTCKRLKITRDKIKKASLFLYQEFGVDNWDIDPKKAEVQNGSN